LFNKNIIKTVVWTHWILQWNTTR